MRLLVCVCAVVVNRNVPRALLTNSPSFQPASSYSALPSSGRWRRIFFHVTSLSWLQTLYRYVAGNIKHNNLRTMGRRARSALKLFLSFSCRARCCNIFNQFFLRFLFPLFSLKVWSIALGKLLHSVEARVSGFEGKLLQRMLWLASFSMSLYMNSKINRRSSTFPRRISILDFHQNWTFARRVRKTILVKGRWMPFSGTARLHTK